MKRLLATAALASALAACTTTAPPTSASAKPSASPHEAAILAVVDRFLLAIGNHDDVLLEEVMINEGVSYIQTIKGADERPVKPYTNESMLEPDPSADPFIEWYWDPIVNVRGGMAQVWAPYELRDNGKQVHCGIDAFDLVFLDGQWRVAAILSTMEPDACKTMMTPTPTTIRPRDGWKETRNE